MHWTRELTLVNNESEQNTGIVKVEAILPEEATTKEIEKWEVTNSSPAGVVEITPSGNNMSCTVKAKKKGTATLTAKDGSGVKATCKVIVTGKPN